MPVTNTPIFIQKGNISSTMIGAANTTSNGTGTLGALFTPGANGSRVDYITIVNSQATAAASSAMVCKIFITDNTGSTPRIIREIVLPTATRSTTAVGASQTITFPGGLLLQPGQLLRCSQTVYAGPQDDVVFTAFGGDY